MTSSHRAVSVLFHVKHANVRNIYVTVGPNYQEVIFLFCCVLLCVLPSVLPCVLLINGLLISHQIMHLVLVLRPGPCHARDHVNHP